ncbi:MAG: hypothetical protein KDC34_09705 [Saprospiraceae bacterium]|nr:hypothetical protein [Saprospiraceae bacterium]
MRRWLLFISIGFLSMSMSDCKSGQQGNSDGVASDPEMKGITIDSIQEAPKHTAPDQAAIDSIKAAKTQEKLKKDGN